MYRLRSRSVPHMGLDSPVAQDEQPVHVRQRDGDAARLPSGTAASRAPGTPGAREWEMARVPPISQPPVTTFTGALGGEFIDSPLDTPFEELSENLDMLSPCAQGRTNDPCPSEGRMPVARPPE